MLNYYTEIIETNIRTVEESSWKNHSKEKTMKNFKTHKKLNPFKCPKFYRTDCDLVLLVALFQALLMLVTFTNCSEFHSFSPNNITNRTADTGESSRFKPSGLATFNFSSFLSDKYSQHQRLIAFNTSSMSSNTTITSTSGLKTSLSQDPADLDKLHQIVMQGLGLKSLPDASKMNISQQEYITKYNQYLALVRERRKRELKEPYSDLESADEADLGSALTTYIQNATETPQYSRRRRRSLAANDIVYVRFPVKVDSDPQSDVDEANLRLLLVTKGAHHSRSHSHHHQHHKEGGAVTLKVYQLIEPYGRIWLDSKEIEIEMKNESESRWLEFDVTKAVKGWISGKQANLGLEIHCDKCHHRGAHIVEDLSINTDPDSNPVLNIIGSFGTHREKRSRQHHHFMQNARRKARKTDCYKENQKCCRHTMEVVFKEIKGFEFIIQPKVFDAGYCRGKCPPRYNPAHHHAFLQSLIWKQDRSKAPRPCCAPSKLVELEVLHVDENDNKKLKVSTWSDMRVLECACS